MDLLFEWILIHISRLLVILWAVDRILTTAAAWFLITIVPGSGCCVDASPTLRGFAFPDTIHAARLAIFLEGFIHNGWMQRGEIEMRGVLRNRWAIYLMMMSTKFRLTPAAFDILISEEHKKLRCFTLVDKGKPHRFAIHASFPKCRCFVES